MVPIKVAVSAGKGGVGKTTIACGIASVLAAQGDRVLLIDLDPQSNAAWGLGADPTQPGTAELLLGDNPIPIQISDNLWVLPGGPGLKGHEVMRLDPEALADAIAAFDYAAVIFDCPPGWDHLERLGLVAADTALVVVDAHPFAIQGAARVIETLSARRQKQRQGAQRWALVMSRVDLRRTLDKDLEAALIAMFTDIDRLLIKQDVALSLATTERIPIVKASPNCRGIIDLQKIVGWLRNG
ncbi:MAG TPA: ParA family protein [Candidatus Competibacteraceae bacterium]|nr:ParA family protein [Candidatus Competibacteraceae bacterium]MCP5134187.1 ParA family protein [Gammaproteobacteria bacterium]HPF59949.1 ParA family protein [Candidatus Competibacteraceae bacterium]HRY19134.1 ParA family protein [Candidatus Competibacteraceae bacterium]